MLLPPFGVPAVTAVVCAARLSCQNAGKSTQIHDIRESQFRKNT
jgi:hypothetical protein